MFKPIQTLQALKIALPLLTSGFGRGFIGTGSLSSYLPTLWD